ncbi:unnamed protein product [Parnassius mnemosyne]|uniref:DDE Tnp4 domain-containing protein n=1 Tax=Parnassius mnemosyne TaxID=213953 RepID=A0AAV1LD72_9NEOP
MNVDSTHREIVRNALINLTDLLLKEVTKALEEEKNRKKRIWTKDWILRRDERGASALLLKELAAEDVKEYRLTMRMTPEMFEDLLKKVDPKIKKQDTTMRMALTPRIKLETTLNFLATGDSYRSLQNHYRVSKCSISKFIPEVCDAIYESLYEYIKVPASENNWKTISSGFETHWNFPNCCGAIDGKHILILAPPNCGSEYFSYKGSNSIVLMVVVDFNYKFLYINVGAEVSQSDGGIFKNCSISDEFERGLLPEGLFLLGDDAFPLKPYLLKPYKTYRGPLTIPEEMFNYRLSRARRIEENAFGILMSRFRILDGKIDLKPSTIRKLVFAACSIHNWLRESSPSYLLASAVDQENIHTGEIIPGIWRTEIEERMKDYFNNDGAVPWQYRYISLIM